MVRGKNFPGVGKRDPKRVGEIPGENFGGWMRWALGGKGRRWYSRCRFVRGLVGAHKKGAVVVFGGAILFLPPYPPFLEMVWGVG